MPRTKLRFLVAPSSFKESMTARVASLAIEKGILNVLPSSKVWRVPLADGGAGTVDSLLQAVGGKKVYREVTDPLGRKITAYYGVLSNSDTAVVEMAASSGLALLSVNERNPMLATSYGCGELINYALEEGVKKIILGVGDTATVDGGIGLLQALGVKILDIRGKDIGLGAKSLKDVVTVEANQAKQKLEGVEVLIATDVNNPLLGVKGAAQVFGPQKGASKEMIIELEEGLGNLANVLLKGLRSSRFNFPGAGAAGGVAIGLVSLLGAKIVSGSQLLFDYHKLNEKISNADLVFTGEGSIDEQTLQGKMPAKLAQSARLAKVPLIAFAGKMAIAGKKLKKKGFYSVIPIIDKVLTLSEACSLGPELLTLATSRSLELILLGKKVF